MTDPLNNSDQRPLNRQKVFARMENYEKQIKILKKLNTEMRDEILALRDNNIKLQVENFKLERKLKEATSKYKSSKSRNDLDAVEDLMSSTKISMESLEDDEVSDSRLNLEELESESEDQLQEDLMESQDITESLSLNTIICKEEERVKIEDQERMSGSEEENPVENKSKSKENTTKPKEKTQISKVKQKIIQRIQAGQKYDAMFVSKCLETFFDKETLLRSTVSGKPCRNKKFVRKGYEQLDPDRLEVIKKMFKDRIKREDVDKDTAEARLKKFNSHINVKIQNCRKYYYKRKKDDSQDWWKN